jgi:hypothetical protein
VSDLAVLDRVLSIEAREDVDVLLVIDVNGKSVPDATQIQKLAMMAGELEAFRASEDLKCVPPDAVTCHRVADIITNCATGMAELDRSRKLRTDRLNNEVKRLNALYAVLINGFGEIRKTADKLVIAYAEAEEARVRRERDEQQRLQAEAAAREAAAVDKARAAASETARQAAMAEAETASREIAAAQVAEPAPAPRAFRSSVGTVGLRKSWVVSAFDPDQVPKEYYRHPKVQEALHQVLQAAVRGGLRQIEGVVIEEKAGTSARG